MKPTWSILQRPRQDLTRVSWSGGRSPYKRSNLAAPRAPQQIRRLLKDEGRRLGVVEFTRALPTVRSDSHIDTAFTARGACPFYSRIRKVRIIGRLPTFYYIRLVRAGPAPLPPAPTWRHCAM